MTPSRRGPDRRPLDLPAVGALGPQEVPTVPFFDVHLVTDCPPPARVADELDELLDVLNDVEATVEAPEGLIEVRATVEADDVVGAVRAGHGIVDRALITLGRVGTVTHVRAASV